MTLAWLQLCYRQTEANSFSTETAVAFITAKIVASFFRPETNELAAAIVQTFELRSVA
jgi:hypothetical protein